MCLLGWGKGNGAQVRSGLPCDLNGPVRIAPTAELDLLGLDVYRGVQSGPGPWAEVTQGREGGRRCEADKEDWATLPQLTSTLHWDEEPHSLLLPSPFVMKPCSEPVAQASLVNFISTFSLS